MIKTKETFLIICCCCLFWLFVFFFDELTAMKTHRIYSPWTTGRIDDIEGDNPKMPQHIQPTAKFPENTRNRD
jgi:hypothetical protein